MNKIKMKSKYKGICLKCKDSIPQGKEVYYLPDNKKIKHIECAPTTTQAPSSPAPKSPVKLKTLTNKDVHDPISTLPLDWENLISQLEETDLERTATLEQAILLIKYLYSGTPPF